MIGFGKDMECATSASGALVFRVKKSYLWLALSSYTLASLPLVVVGLSPDPGVGGWIAFSILAFCFIIISSAGVLFALRAKVIIWGKKLNYFGVWRSYVLDLENVMYAYASFGNLVIDIGKKRRVVIPNVFQEEWKLIEIITKHGGAGR